ncbi:MAG: RHS repeat-associated core domain-containing protein, partial [Burkholderiales bacterium]
GQGSTGTTLYFYADEGLIAEVDGNAGSTTLGNITTSYGWVPASPNTGTWGTAPQWKRDHAGQSGATNPQGDASTNGVEHYYHVDHLGTSQRLTNTQGETTWRMVSEAFGKTLVDTILAPATTGTTTNNLRFPGQYEDQETGTYYNYMRTYLPMVGRYGESDPIGLGGGVNTFSYVGGNPLSYIDPLGLMGGGGNHAACSCPTPPKMPPPPENSCSKESVLDRNIKEAYFMGLIPFYSNVRNKGPWDYKQQGSQYQDFGNFNYGATGYSAGLSAILLPAAGWAQSRAGTSKPAWGSWYGKAPYGDDPADQEMILAGMRYARCGCKQ